MTGGQSLSGMRATLDRLLSNRLLCIAAMIAVAVILIFVLCRVGVMPAASAGDDVWYDDSGYWLIKEGVLRRHIHDNAQGDAIRDFLPPIAGLFTAVSFKLFGLSQFAIGLPPTFASVVGGSGMAAGLRRRFHLPWVLAAGLATLPFFTPELIKVIGHNRFEAYVFCFMGLGLWAGARREEESGTPVRLVLAGLCAGLAIIAHYPVAPMTWGIVAWWSCTGARPLRALGWFCAGSALAGIGGLIWIGPDLHMFFAQMLGSSVRYDHSLAYLPMTTILYLALAVAAFALGYRDRQSLGFGVLSLISAIAIWWWQSEMLYAAIAAVLALACLFQRNDATAQTALARLLLLVLMVTTAGTAAIASVVSIRSYPERNYAAFKRNLLQVLPANRGGYVLIDRQPWLALRACYGPKQLEQYVGGQTLPPTILFDAGNAAKVEAVVADPSLMSDHAKFPLQHAFLARSLKMIEVSPFGVGAGVIHRGPYHVAVYLAADDHGPRLASQCR